MDATPSNPTPTSTSNPKNFIILLLSLALLIGAFFLYKVYNGAQQKDQELAVITRVQEQTDSLYQTLKAQITSYKDENIELYEKLESKEIELEKLYGKIKRQITQTKREQAAKKSIEQKLEELEKEFITLQTYVEEQTKNLNELKEENKKLRIEKQQLSQQAIEDSLALIEMEKEALKLQQENEQLAAAISQAEILKIFNLQVQGQKLKGSGKAKSVKYAKRTDYLEVCFEIMPNTVLAEGENHFYLRVIQPNKELIYLPVQGSDSFIESNSGASLNYTDKVSFEYTKSLKNYCLQWKNYPEALFTKGLYTLEVYNKGYKVGQTALVLK